VPCAFTIAALIPDVPPVDPAAVDVMESTLRRAAPDLRRLNDTESTIVWQGTMLSRGLAQAIPISVTLYKAARRVRIQPLTHDLAASQFAVLDDGILSALRASVVSRHRPDVERPPRVRGDGEPGADWPAWLPPPGYETRGTRSG
jgi:hypothetical protein